MSKDFSMLETIGLIAGGAALIAGGTAMMNEGKRRLNEHSSSNFRLNEKRRRNLPNKWGD